MVVTICGAGAVGGNLAEHLARSGWRDLRVIDCDRVEAHNLENQPYRQCDVGLAKTHALERSLFDIAGLEIDARAERLAEHNARRLLRGSAIAVDAFDNAASRMLVKRACDDLGVPCLHVGLAAGYAELRWNPDYRIEEPSSGSDLCGEHRARDLVMVAVVLAALSLSQFRERGEAFNREVAIKDLWQLSTSI